MAAFIGFGCVAFLVLSAHLFSNIGFTSRWRLKFLNGFGGLLSFLASGYILGLGGGLGIGA